MKIALAQVNPTVGDLGGNTDLILKFIRDAEARACDLVVFPELVLTGYPPEDLLFKPAFLQDNLAALRRLAGQIQKSAAVVGFVDVNKGKRFNAAAWIEQGRVAGIYHKICLPNDGVFDEKRYFEAGTAPFLKNFRGWRVGVTICEDVWLPESGLKSLRSKKPDVVLNLSSSPFHSQKLELRHKVVRTAARYVKAPVLYCNTVGGQDELVFDGGSFGVRANGGLAVQGPPFETGVIAATVEKKGGRLLLTQEGAAARRLSPLEEIFQALLLGVRDYVNKNGFEKVAVGLSGGIDSSLVAVLAAKALGPERVVGVTMPSRYNVSETRADAARLAENLGIRLIELPIQPLYDDYLKALAPVFTGMPAGLAEENLQSRIRGSLLMALSNKFGWLVLTTGNKSEISTGYCTLYGDTAGGFAVLKDVVKTTIYKLAGFVNEQAGRDLIPSSVIARPPTAELKENQLDEDVLGPYAELDPLIEAYVEKNRPLGELIKGAPGKAAYVRKIVALIDRNEYKRRQAPPGIKITPRSFGRDHRMPITNRYAPK